MKTLMIDPWGVNHILHYTNGICKGISKHCELSLLTNYYYQKTSEANYEYLPVFFRMSEKMEHGKLRKYIRGFEYIAAYRKIINELKRHKYDVVHIQWLLQYKLDVHFLKIMKQYCGKIVYTAHNVVPHTNGERYIDVLRIIYGLVDNIAIHGEGIREEFIKLFPEFQDKIIIQRHGTYLNQKITYDQDSVERDIVNKIAKYNKVFIFFGNMFYNKGVDRLVKIWLEHFKQLDQLLIICGRKSADYVELDELEQEISKCKNILYINRFIEDNLLNYLTSKSDMILLPYRHASMSGVIFTAAEFKKTVLCTDTGSIAEYVVNGENSFVVENSDEAFGDKLKYISREVSKETLAEMGSKLNEYIVRCYSWDNIGEKLVNDAYVAVG